MTKEWVQVGTIGATAGTDLKESDGTVLADTAVKNSSVALAINNSTGALTLTNAGSGVTLSNASVGLANVANVDMRDLGNANAGTLAVARGGTALSSITTLLNANTTASDVDLGNVPNVDMRNLDNATGGTLAVARGGTALSSITTLLNANTTKTQVGLSNVANETRATILGGDLTGTLNASSFPMRAMVTGANAAAVKTTIALNNVDNTSDATVLAADHTGDVTGKVNNVAVATVTSGAALGTSSNQDSTATIRNGVTTYVVNKGTSIIWTNISGQMSPNDTTYDWTITWRNGSGTSLGATVIRTALNGTTALAGMSTQSDGASATINLGGATSAGSTQTTTVTVNSVTVSLTAKIIDGSGWGFK